MKWQAAKPHHCSVLVIDDDDDLQELLRISLEKDGYQVAGVSNGRDALSHLRSTADTCIIVLDLALPQMDGQRFRAAQLRDRSLAWIPVIVLSGATEATRQAREIGARSFVPKPVDLDELRQALRFVGCCRSQPRTEHRGEATVSGK